MASKLVNFYQYCKECKYRDLSENDDPCEECLTNPVNEDSHKPTKWESNEE